MEDDHVRDAIDSGTPLMVTRFEPGPDANAGGYTGDPKAPRVRVDLIERAFDARRCSLELPDVYLEL